MLSEHTAVFFLLRQHKIFLFMSFYHTRGPTNTCYMKTTMLVRKQSSFFFKLDLRQTNLITFIKRKDSALRKVYFKGKFKPVVVAL